MQKEDAGRVHKLGRRLNVVDDVPRVVTKQYSNGLFGSFDAFEPSKQTIFSGSDRQTKFLVCLAVWQTLVTIFDVDMMMRAILVGLVFGVQATSRSERS